MRANVPEWEPGRRGTVETLLSDFAPPFPALKVPECRRFAAQRVKLSKQGFGTMAAATHSKISSRASRWLPTSLEPAAGGLYNSRIEISPRGIPPEPIVRE